jgi:SAM-dependent methyltransferase
MPRLRRLRNSLAPIKRPVESALQLSARSAGAWASFTHKLLMWWQWGVPPVPEHFDHQIDLYYYWKLTRESLWVERGVFSSLCLDGGDVLELCCGDGFHARNFYSLRSRRIVACDFDPKAIATARHKNHAPNIEFVVADIRTAMPEGEFGTVIWDAAIEHFTEDETTAIIGALKQRLKFGGILSGYTIVETGQGLSLPHHEYEFKSKSDLLRLFSPHFANVRVFETITPNRHNLYLWASDGVIPFDESWGQQVLARSASTLHFVRRAPGSS